jgi:hypothetical protein
MGAGQDLLGVGVNLNDDGTVVVVLTFDEDHIATIAPHEAALIGAAIINAAGHAGRIEIEISELPVEQREVGIRNIRDRYSAGSN